MLKIKMEKFQLIGQTFMDLTNGLKPLKIVVMRMMTFSLVLVMVNGKELSPIEMQPIFEYGY